MTKLPVKQDTCKGPHWMGGDYPLNRVIEYRVGRALPRLIFFKRIQYFKFKWKKLHEISLILIKDNN